MHRTRFHDERGATAVLMALCMVGLLAFGGLVLDGGNAFAQRRQMQNAADSSAMASTNALYRYKLLGGSTNSVYDSARQSALDNGAASSTFSCVLVFQNATTLVETGTAPCNGATAANLAAAWKVRVAVDQSSKTRLMRVVQIDSFTAKGAAAASLLEAAGAASPFMVCGAPGTAHHPDLLQAVSTAVDPTGWRINPAAINVEYDIWGNAIKDSDCGYKGSSFRGLVDDEDVHSIPGTWPADSGNKGGNKIAGNGASFVNGCDLNGVKIKDVTMGCEIVIPLCTSPGADKKTLYLSLIHI